jgi:NAD(P)-dependent dehydrogenase (short-subunit alcohol dehydrogenase family)
VIWTCSPTTVSTVTGASGAGGQEGHHHRRDSGIGRAVAIAFAREGSDVLITCLESEQDDARETAHWVFDAGRRVFSGAASAQRNRGVGV